MAGRRFRTVVLAVALVIPVGGTVAACEVQERAVDCTKLAIAVSRSYDELERTALTAALDEEPAQFTDAVRADAEKVRDRTGNVDVQRAADAVLAAATAVQEAADAGEKPDLSALGEAIAELTKVCTPA